MSKYWKKVIHVEILSEGEHPPVFDNLQDVHYAIHDGPCSGMTEEIMVIPLSREHMAESLINQGSDPAFLIEDWEEDEE